MRDILKAFHKRLPEGIMEQQSTRRSLHSIIKTFDNTMTKERPNLKEILKKSINW